MEVDQTARNKDISTASEIAKLYRRCNFIPGEGGRDEPLYGELNFSSMNKIMKFYVDHCNFNSSSTYMDIGSGLGKTVFLAALYPGVVKSIGVEISDYRYDASLQLKYVLETKWHYDFHKVQIIHGDIKNMTKFEATHIYAFFVRMSEDCFPQTQVAKAFMRSANCKYITSFSPPSTMSMFGYRVNLVGSLKVRAQGHGSSTFTTYTYEKNK